MVAPAIIAAGIIAGGALAGGAASGAAAERAAGSDRASQREFAQYGIRWRVHDARMAGLHPLFAINQNTTSFTPVARVGQGAMGRGVSRAAEAVGQGYLRAATQSANSELTSLQLRQATAQTKIAELDYEMMAHEFSRLKGGHGNINQTKDQIDQAIEDQAGQIEIQPSEITSTEPGNRSRTAGTSPMFRKVRILDTKWGHIDAAIVDSDDTSEGISEFGPLMASIFGTIALWLGEEPRYVKENWMSKKYDKYRVRAAAVVKQWFKKNRPEVYRAPHRTSKGVIR